MALIIRIVTVSMNLVSSGVFHPQPIHQQGGVHLIRGIKPKNILIVGLLEKMCDWCWGAGGRFWFGGVGLGGVRGYVMFSASWLQGLGSELGRVTEISRDFGLFFPKSGSYVLSRGGNWPRRNHGPGESSGS